MEMFALFVYHDDAYSKGNIKLCKVVKNINPDKIYAFWPTNLPHLQVICIETQTC